MAKLFLFATILLLAAPWALSAEAPGSVYVSPTPAPAPAPSAPSQPSPVSPPASPPSPVAPPSIVAPPVSPPVSPPPHSEALPPVSPPQPLQPYLAPQTPQVASPSEAQAPSASSATSELPSSLKFLAGVFVACLAYLVV